MQTVDPSTPGKTTTAPGTSKPQRVLSLLDSTNLIVGIIIGVGIYQMAPLIAKGAGSPWGLMLIWLAGGLVSLCGALNYAELATAYPREGGDFVYLSRAYGRWAGFLFGWVQLAVVRPGDIAVMAFAFAAYAHKLYDPLGETAWFSAQTLYAALVTVILTLINILGVHQAKWTQNLLTTVKALGLLTIVGVALLAPKTGQTVGTVEGIPVSLAFIFVLFTFGGWNEMAYVAAEVKNPRRNIVRALVLGTVAVTVLYLLVNGAFLYALGYHGMATSQAVATDTVATVFPDFGGRFISVLVCLSALGAVNGLIFTGARISYAVGEEHRVLRPLGRWHAHTGTPVWALALQGMLAVVLILALRSFVDTLIYTAAPVYSFYLATTVAVWILRRKDPRVERPYRVTWFPLPTLVFAAVCLFLIRSAVIYKPWIAAAALGIILLGLPLYWFSNRIAGRSGSGSGGKSE
jgi:basic amino acid/polyamine antiporter, APA family